VAEKLSLAFAQLETIDGIQRSVNLTRKHANDIHVQVESLREQLTRLLTQAKTALAAVDATPSWQPPDDRAPATTAPLARPVRQAVPDPTRDQRHADGTTPTLLAALQSLLRLEAHRTGDLPISDVTCLLWQTSPQHAIDDLKDQLYGLIDQRLDPSAHGQAVEQIVRSGWASVDDILDLGHLEPAWNWDTIDHDCTQNRKRLVYGMYLPNPADGPDEIPSPAANRVPPPGSAGSVEQSGDCLEVAPPSAQAIGTARS